LNVEAARMFGVRGNRKLRCKRKTLVVLVHDGTMILSVMENLIEGVLGKCRTVLV